MLYNVFQPLQVYEKAMLLTAGQVQDKFDPVRCGDTFYPTINNSDPGVVSAPTVSWVHQLPNLPHQLFFLTNLTLARLGGD